MTHFCLRTSTDTTLRFFAAVALTVSVLPCWATDDVPDLEEAAVREAVKSISASVVRIETIGGVERVGRLLVGTGPTTGLVVSEDGYILSSAFNFIQNPASILVTLPGGQRAAATVTARDHSRMLVLLKVSVDEPLSVPSTVPRSEIQVGQWALAVGRTYDDAQPSVSMGIVSATNRIWGKAIQTDAKVSPSNYGGPLVDIGGRVLGILVPLSPDAHDEVAGAEWYDSGIGFAIPLYEYQPRLDKLRQGQDLYAGVLGVHLRAGNVYRAPAVIAACHPTSPAAKAGLKAGDEIVEIDGMKIRRQVQLKHALGPRYAGETIRLSALRGDERLDLQIELTDRLQPYQHPFLGVLPRRDGGDGKASVVVRYVYPGGPADEAGVTAGDRLVRFAEKEVESAASLREYVAEQEPDATVSIEFQRGEDTRTAAVKLSRIPEDVVGGLPPAHEAVQPSAQRPAVGIVDITIPEESNKCVAYVPDSYDDAVPHGLVVWLDVPGPRDREELVARWKDICAQRDLIVLAPQSADPARWQPTEVGFVRKAMENVMDRYRIDRTRIVVHGYQAGGSLAFRVAFAHRDLVRAVSPIDAALPPRVRPPDNEPAYRMAIYTSTAKDSKLAEQISAGIDRLRELKYPVTVKELGETGRYLNAEELAELARWIDSLDRI